jgi:hypothetical protein
MHFDGIAWTPSRVLEPGSVGPAETDHPQPAVPSAVSGGAEAVAGRVESARAEPANMAVAGARRSVFMITPWFVVVRRQKRRFPPHVREESAVRRQRSSAATAAWLPG